MSRKTISVSMIVRNESECIEACLESVKGADEIVIVDTGSEDNTVEICKKYTKNVYSDGKLTWIRKLLLHFPFYQKKYKHLWRDNFSYSRNLSLSYCTSDFILIIDADEILKTPIDQIIKLINEPFFDKQFCGATFTVQTQIETFPSPRLFKNCKEIRYIHAAHNLPAWNGSTPELQIKMYTSACEISSGYSPAHYKDIDRTLRILKKLLRKNPDETRYMYYLAVEYMNKKQIHSAIKIMEKYRKIKYFDCDKWDNELADALYLLALMYSDYVIFGNKKWHRSLQIAMESFNVLPSAKATSILISVLLNEPPTSEDEKGRRQQFAASFWHIIGENSNDKGVLMKRVFPNPIKEIEEPIPMPMN